MEIILAFLYPGDLFGESALINDSARDHLTEAYEAARVWSIGRSLLLDLFAQTPALGYGLLRLMLRSTHQLQTRVEGLLHRNAHARVAQTLLNLAADRSVANKDGLQISIRATQADLANMAGLARETVNIVLMDLRTRGFVEMTRGRIRLRQPAALRSACAVTPRTRLVVRHGNDRRVPSSGGRAPLGTDARLRASMLPTARTA